MRISECTALTFKRRLKPAEEADYCAVLNSAKTKIGNTGKSVLIIPSQVLPENVDSNTGIGSILNKESAEFFDFVKTYWGINTIEDLPNGKLKNAYGTYLPYSGSSLSLGEQNINFKLLTTDNFAKILSEKDFNEIVESNKSPQKDFKINYENILKEDSAGEKALKKAFANLKLANTETKRKMLSDIQQYIEENKEWLEPKALFEDLAHENRTNNFDKWNSFDKNLFNPDEVNPRMRSLRILELKNKYATEHEYIYFKQYLAEKHLEAARKQLNSMGLEYFGDFLINFSPDEKWSNPKAFYKEGYSVGYGCPALNLDSQEAKKLLAKKIKLFARRYDGIRIDMAWAYADQPLIKCFDKHEFKKVHYDGEILDYISDVFRHTKGKDYKQESIMYEFVASPNDFNMYEDGKLKQFLENKIKIICSDYLEDNWGSSETYKQRGWKIDSYILGATNHDSQPMKSQFVKENELSKQASILARLLKIPEPKNLKDFIKAKFAEPMRAKHNMVFYADALNLDGKYAASPINDKSYRLKLPHDWMDKYFQSLQYGEGFNPMDALAKAFVAEGLDKTEPELYQKIIKYRKILEQPESRNKKTKNLLMLGGVIFAAITVIGALIIKKGVRNSDTHSRYPASK